MVFAAPATAASSQLVHPTPIPVVKLSVQHYLHDEGTVVAKHALGSAAQDGTVPPPFSTADCLAAIGYPCYGPTQLAHAYGADAAQRQGLTGRGATIALVESYGSPAIQSDLDTFDSAYGLPATSVETIPFGTLPGSVTTDDEIGWAEETTLDVEYAHAMAPWAHLVVLAVGADETTGDTGMDQMSAAMTWLVEHRHVDALSLSWGAMEANFAEEAGSTAAGNQLIYSVRGGLIAAAQHHVSVLVASGDDGDTGPNLALSDYYPFKTVSWPASDPLVTAVGGNKVSLDDTNNLVGVTAWTYDHRGVAGGGGLSVAFPRPGYQSGVRSVVGGQRGMADISADASCDSSVVIYTTYRPGPAGWARVCGTSASAPMIAGLVGDAAALAHHPVGQINRVLYSLNSAQRAKSLVDVTEGCNTFTLLDGSVLPGYCSGAGYDLPTGWGTVGNAGALIRQLADR